jgi:hypothetical protein
MRNYILGAGVSGLIMSFMTDTPAIPVAIPSQSLNRFPLGPRILHKDNDSEKLLRDLGIKEPYKQFAIGHFDGDLATGQFVDPDAEWKQKYIRKTRTTNVKLESAMSGGHKYINGWDIGDIKLIPELQRRAQVIKNIATKIDAERRTIITLDKRELEYGKCISTIKLPAFYDLIGYPIPEPYEARKTRFVLIEGGPLLALKGNFSYIYFADKKLPFNRVTFLDGDKMVIEIPEEFFNVPLDFILVGTSFLDEVTVGDCQIVSVNKRIQRVLGVEMVGRYAKWNHALLINDVIKDGIKYAKAMRVRY